MTQKAVFLEGIFTSHNLRSMGAAAIIEVLIASGIAGVLVWQQLRPYTPPRQEPHPVTFPDEPPPLPRTMPVPEQQPLQAPQPSEVPPVQESIPSPTAVPLQPPSPPPIQNAGRPARGNALTEFEASMKQAIDSAKVYPQVAVLKGETGTATVSFDYAAGVVSNVHVDKSSGVRRLDDAAMLAVQKAAMPPKPAELAGTSHFVILVGFTLGN